MLDWFVVGLLGKIALGVEVRDLAIVVASFAKVEAQPACLVGLFEIYFHNN